MAGEPLADKLPTILFVDDETALRESIAALLSQRGFRILAAGTGHEALAILADHPADVLFADLVMPDINGIRLAQQAKLMRPRIKVLFATGYPQRATAAIRHGRLLLKPLRAPEIEAELRSLLAA
jgi:CheY-like chemotaxis protein